MLNQRKIKVAQILYSGLGGHGSVAFSLLDATGSKKWDPMLGFLGIEPLLHAYRQRCDSLSIPYKYFGAVVGRPIVTWSGITSWLYRERPDAIILHSVKAVLPCLIYSKRFDVPLIFVEHQANALKSRSDWWISRLGMLFSSKVIFLTSEYRAENKKKLGVLFRDNKVEIIPNGINTVKFRPTIKDSSVRKKICIGMAARFTDMRRQDVLVNSLEDLIGSAPGFEWHLSLAGSGETLPIVQKLVTRKNLIDHVTLTGYLNEDQMIGWFQTLDVYVHASEGETLSTSILQAMACGLPIVGSDVPGINNLIAGSNACGVLVNHQDPSAFAKAVIQIVDGGTTASRFGDSGRRTSLEKYSHEVMFEHYDALIESLVSKEKICKECSR